MSVFWRDLFKSFHGRFPGFLLEEHVCLISAQGKGSVFTASSVAFIKIPMILGQRLLFFFFFEFSKLVPFLLFYFLSTKQRPKTGFKKFYTFSWSPSLLTFRPWSKTFLLSQAFPIGKLSSSFFLWEILTAGLNLIIVFCIYSQEPPGHELCFLPNFQINIFRNACFCRQWCSFNLDFWSRSQTQYFCFLPFAW